MLDSSTLETELVRATGLLTKSKDYIYYLSNKLMGVEANLVTHVTMLANNTGVEEVITNVTDKFSSVFTDFEDFLGTFINAEANTTVVDTNVASNTVVSTPLPVPEVIPPHHNMVEGIMEEIKTDFINVVHTIDPRLFHDNAPNTSMHS